MSDNKTLDRHREALTNARRTLARLLEDAEAKGVVEVAPAQLATAISEARDQIRWMKALLRANDASVADHPNDEPQVDKVIVLDVEGSRDDNSGRIFNSTDSRAMTAQHHEHVASPDQGISSVVQLSPRDGGYRISNALLAADQESISSAKQGRRKIVAIVLTGLLVGLIGVATNIATSVLPVSWDPYLWLAWPLFIILIFLSIGLAIWQYRLETSFSKGYGTQSLRNRTIMLEKVWAIWISGFLERSFTQEARLALNLIERPDAVEVPLNALVQELDSSPRFLPAGKSIVTVFDLMGGSLLILGAPGSGKTTLLLELARTLLERARHDQHHPIPVVLNLASWAAQHRSLDQWLVDELNTKYDVPRTIGNVWAESDALLPLLDGLDEVPRNQQLACVIAINNFRRNHGVKIAVCSRIADYEILSKRLRLQGAVLISPLTEYQISTYLTELGEDHRSLRNLIEKDAHLRKLAETPLMLGIMTIVYRNDTIEIEGSKTIGNENLWKEYFLFEYVDRMFKRRGRTKNFAKAYALKWLTWLARAMMNQSQPVFFLEQLQADLLSRKRRLLFNILSRLFVFIFVTSILFGINEVYNLYTGQYGNDAKLVLCVAGLSALYFQEVSRTTHRKNILQNTLIGAFLGATMAWLLNVLLEGWNVRHIEFAFVSIIAGSLFGALLGKPKLRSLRINVVETLHWTWKGSAIAGMRGLVLGVGVVILARLATDIYLQLLIWTGKLGDGWISIGADSALITTLSAFIQDREHVISIPGRSLGSYFYIYILIGGIVSGVASAISGGLVGGSLIQHDRPNQGIRRSLLCAIIALFGITCSFALVIVAFGWELWGVQDALLAGLNEGFVIGVVGGLTFGGYTVLAHVTLRILLWLSGAIPLGYVRFLDYAADRIFLRKVGGGYVFIHRILMEYFADPKDEGENGNDFSETFGADDNTTL
jgi:eukaryotic-like serine/threonine-protein kinase